MQKPLLSLSILVACGSTLLACTPSQPETTVSNNYQAPVAAITPPANVKTICYTDNELMAFRVRMVQQELVVGALQCKGPDGKMYLDDEYAAFMKKYNPELSSNAAEIKSVVARKKANLDVMVTEIAHRTAQRPRLDPDFCSRHQRAFDWALHEKVMSLKEVPAPYDLGPEMRVFPCPKG
jgi:hypothetical protein